MTEQDHAHHSEQIKVNLKSRLNRIEGQVRAINRMIEEDVYCDDVLTQIRATRSALNSVATFDFILITYIFILQSIKSYLLNT